MILTFELPYPPSVNHYWRVVNNRVLISREGRAFRRRVCSILAATRVEPLSGPLALKLEVHPPDRRRRDLDNCLKSILDALEKGGAYQDDSQIDLLVAQKCAPVRGGLAIVKIIPQPLVRCPLCGARYG